MKLHIDETIKPVAQPHRRVPFYVRSQLENQLKADEALGVIGRVNGATPWVSPLVVVPKPKCPDQVRVCVDMRRANTAVLRERHITPPVNEIINDLNGACVFSKLDLNHGYNQFELEPSSRGITTFSSHLGLWRYKRLDFGISSAAEVFPNAIRETLSGLNGVVNMSDDILIFARDQSTHDANLRACFQRLQEKGLTLNPAKCVYNKSNLDFFGYTFTQNGMKINNKKVSAVCNLPAPTNQSEVRSLLGMTNFLSRFVRDYANITHPLRLMTQKQSSWTWSTKYEKAFETLRTALCKAPTLSYFHTSRDTEIHVDASPIGLAAILVQPDVDASQHVVAYASRALSPVQQRYSRVER